MRNKSTSWHPNSLSLCIVLESSLATKLVSPHLHAPLLFAFLFCMHLVCYGSLEPVVILERDDDLASTSDTSPLNPVSSPFARFLFDVDRVFGPHTFQCSLDQSPWNTCVSPLSLSSPLPDGTHTFAVRIGGRQDTAVTHTWIIGT